ncbi:hypothetical protein STENM223S_11069 [Streptomyces tendae]
MVRVSRATAEWTAYRSAVPGAAAVPTASAARGRREVPRECSSTRSAFSGCSGPWPPPTTEEAGAGRSRSRCTSAVSRAALRPGPLRCRGDHRARRVVQRRPAVDLRGERGQQALRAVGQGLPGQLRWAAKPAVTARYWSAAIAAETALLMARNGVRRGTSSSGSPSLRAALDQRLGDRRRSRRRRRIRAPPRRRPASRLTYAAHHLGGPRRQLAGAVISGQLAALACRARGRRRSLPWAAAAPARRGGPRRRARSAERRGVDERGASVGGMGPCAFGCASGMQRGGRAVQPSR